MGAGSVPALSIPDFPTDLELPKAILRTHQELDEMQRNNNNNTFGGAYIVSRSPGAMVTSLINNTLAHHNSGSGGDDVQKNQNDAAGGGGGVSGGGDGGGNKEESKNTKKKNIIISIKKMFTTNHNTAPNQTAPPKNTPSATTSQRTPPPASQIPGESTPHLSTMIDVDELLAEFSELYLDLNNNLNNPYPTSRQHDLAHIPILTVDNWMSSPLDLLHKQLKLINANKVSQLNLFYLNILF